MHKPNKTSSSACNFCSYREIESQIIHEDEFLRVIYPRRPIFDHHLMIVPVKHFSTFDELDADTAKVLPVVVGKVKQAFNNDKLLGYNIFSNNGDEAIGQSVPHFHLHMFIRYSDEEVSPYELMNKSIRQDMDEDKWVDNLSLFKDLLQSPNS